VKSKEEKQVVEAAQERMEETCKTVAVIDSK